jgi:hypothetical protein
MLPVGLNPEEPGTWRAPFGAWVGGMPVALLRASLDLAQPGLTDETIINLLFRALGPLSQALGAYWIANPEQKRGAAIGAATGSVLLQLVHFAAPQIAQIPDDDPNRVSRLLYVLTISLLPLVGAYVGARTLSS